MKHLSLRSRWWARFWRVGALCDKMMRLGYDSLPFVGISLLVRNSFWSVLDFGRSWAFGRKDQVFSFDEMASLWRDDETTSSWRDSLCRQDKVLSFLEIKSSALTRSSLRLWRDGELVKRWRACDEIAFISKINMKTLRRNFWTLASMVHPFAHQETRLFSSTLYRKAFPSIACLNRANIDLLRWDSSRRTESLRWIWI